MKYNVATDVTFYVNSLNSVGCNVCIDKPTRVDGSTATCLDHIYSNLSPDRLDSHILIVMCLTTIVCCLKFKAYLRSKTTLMYIFVNLT